MPKPRRSRPDTAKPAISQRAAPAAGDVQSAELLIRRTSKLSIDRARLQARRNADGPASRAPLDTLVVHEDAMAARIGRSEIQACRSLLVAARRRILAWSP